ncbi:MAG: 50S ribosomal protein L30e [Candidatus Micrarchaeota archaeon]|nr:50S ribosomal protein L30e [Candidatus Micrarchaeota archaeon]
MADLANDIRLAVDSGDTAIGINSVEQSIKSDKAKVVVIASNNKKETIEDLMHLAKIANIRVLTIKGNSMDLGSICGKPYSVSAVSVISPGNSKILDEKY